MAWSTGSIAASATPATDLMAVIAAKLTAAGWTEETTRTYTAGIMGTTAACEVWYSPTTTSAAGPIWTGCLISFEVDDANSRIRVRVMEIFDASLSATPSANTKYAAPGHTTTAAVPTANGGYVAADAFVNHFQAAGTGQTVGWCELSTVAGGFDYWVGANDQRVILMTNSGGIPTMFLGGHVDYAGDRGTSIGNNAVFLAACLKAADTNSGSWSDNSTSGTRQPIARVSRVPNSAITSSAQHWKFTIGGPQSGGGPEANAIQAGNPYGGPGMVGLTPTGHVFHNATMIVFNAWLQPSFTTGDRAVEAGRSHFARIPECLVFLNPTMGANTSALSQMRPYGPHLGETVTVDGVTYTSMGIAQAVFWQTDVGAMCDTSWLLVNGDEF